LVLALLGWARDLLAMVDAAPLLEQHRIFHGRDADATRAFLHSRGFGFDLPGKPGTRADLDARLNGVYMPNLWLGYNQYGAAAEIRMTPVRDDYWVQLPIRGNVAIASGGREIACDRRSACVLSPRREHLIRSDANSARLQLAINGPALVRQLAALLGDTPHRPLEFAPSLALDEGFGRSLARYVVLAVQEFERAEAAAWSPLVMSQFEQLIMTGLLLSQPHEYSDALRRHERPPAPRDVKRVTDFIHDNLTAPITLADLVTASGVAGRTLFQHFRDFKGLSPMRYLRNARFERVRMALLDAAPHETVTEIAMRWGFGHMGRFSVEYRQRFGESPSATRRGRLCRSGPVDPLSSTVHKVVTGTA
jgi:AraC-like DNA-binding protein